LSRSVCCHSLVEKGIVGLSEIDQKQIEQNVISAVEILTLVGDLVAHKFRLSHQAYWQVVALQKFDRQQFQPTGSGTAKLAYDVVERLSYRNKLSVELLVYLTPHNKFFGDFKK
jgi:hypothetical protein